MNCCSGSGYPGKRLGKPEANCWVNKLGAMGMAQFWVVGGHDPEEHVMESAGVDEEWFGPFSDYETAEAEWTKLTRSRPVESDTFYRIERIDPDIPPPCTD